MRVISPRPTRRTAGLNQGHSTPFRADRFRPIFRMEERTMRVLKKQKRDEGKVGWILLWLLGIPIPVLLLLFVLRGCT